MLKTRLMPTLLYKDSTLVKGVGFDSWRRVGSLMQAVKIYNMRQVDELIFLDITATEQGRHPDFNLVDDFADECFMPLTVGGGVRTVNDVKELLRVGADKVAINTVAVENPSVIQEMSNQFGAQCIVVSIDIKKNKEGIETVWTHSGSKDSGLNPVQFAIEVERLGAGEILLTDIDQDGTMEGYNCDALLRVSNAVNIPVIASGGAGSYQDMKKALVEGQASAIAAASIFHFTEQTPLEAKMFLHDEGFPTRVSCN